MKKTFVPVLFGGGISSIDDISLLLKLGIDRFSINTAALKKPEIINQISNKIGSANLVVSIECKKIDISSYIAVKGLKAKGNQLDQKEIKLINKLDPIPYQPPVNDLNNIEVVDEKIDSNEDNDGSNNQTKLDF